MKEIILILLAVGLTLYLWFSEDDSYQFWRGDSSEW